MNNKLFYTGFLLLPLLISSCSLLNFSNQSSTQFNFEFEDNTYSIRSVSLKENSKSFNQLVGNNLVVRDIDRDGVVDQVIIGDKSLSEAQKIYDFGLELLAHSNKLRVHKVLYTHYIQNNTEYNYQLKSFQPKGCLPFNEFKITNINNDPSSVIILIDQNADGNLDEALKGTENAEIYQSNYNYVLSTGLEKNKLIKSGNKILVKK